MFPRFVNPCLFTDTLPLMRPHHFAKGHEPLFNSACTKPNNFKMSSQCALMPSVTADCVGRRFFGGPLYRRIPHCLSLMFAASGKQCVQHAVCTDIQLLCDYVDANLCSEYSRSETDCGIDCLTTMMEDKLCSKFWNRETEKKKKKTLLLQSALLCFCHIVADDSD